MLSYYITIFIEFLYFRGLVVRMGRVAPFVKCLILQIKKCIFYYILTYFNLWQGTLLLVKN